MPNYSYYNPYMNAYPVAASYPMNIPYSVNNFSSMQQMPQNQPQYMINVDGEIGAKAWQMPANLAPNTIIPLWDIDGKHVYFKSVDAYGRLNQMRRGTVVFDDEQISETAKADPIVQPDLSQYVTKQDFESFKNELLQEIKANNRSGQKQYTNYQNGTKVPQVTGTNEAR